MIQGIYFVDMPHMKKIAVNPKFLSRVFSPQEMKFLISKNFSPYVIAEMFCGKMAFAKAMAASFHGCRLNEISILADYSGAYYFSLSGKAKMHFGFKKMKASVSCSHSNVFAMASVIFYEVK